MSSETVSTPAFNDVEDSISPTTALPVKSNLRLIYLSSLLIALLTAVATIAGLLYPDDLYPTEALKQFALANDAVTLVIGLPILLISMWLARRQQLIGLLFWPGALFYGCYNYFAYLLGMPLTAMYPLYMLIVILSVYTTIGLVASIDGGAVKERLAGRVPERFAAGFLVLLAVFVVVRATGMMADALVNDAEITQSDLALLVTDFLFSGAWVIGGVMLWRRQALGYVGGAGLLFQTSMLFVGLLFIMILQPMMTEAPFLAGDFIFVLVLTLICLIPLALFIRGVVRS